MPNFDIYRGMITALEVNDIYLFKLYFDQGDVFGILRNYNTNHNSILRVSDDGVHKVGQIFDKYFYALRIKDSLDSYFVVSQKNTKYSGIRNNVLTNWRSDYITILMHDQSPVGQAQKYGRRRFRELI